MGQGRGQRGAVWWWLALGACLGLIFFLSTRPHLQSPVRFPLWDKAAHLVEYAFLGFLAQGALRRSSRGAARGLGRWRVLLFWAVGVAVALFDEWVQAHVPGRESAMSDLAADAVGIGLGQLAEWRLWIARSSPSRAGAARGAVGTGGSGEGGRR